MSKQKNNPQRKTIDLFPNHKFQLVYGSDICSTEIFDNIWLDVLVDGSLEILDFNRHQAFKNNKITIEKALKMVGVFKNFH